MAFRPAALGRVSTRGAIEPSTTALGDLVRDGAGVEVDPASVVGLRLGPVGRVGFGAGGGVGATGFVGEPGGVTGGVGGGVLSMRTGTGLLRRCWPLTTATAWKLKLALAIDPSEAFSWTVVAEVLAFTGPPHEVTVTPHVSFSWTQTSEVCAGIATVTGTVPATTLFAPGARI